MTEYTLWKIRTSVIHAYYTLMLIPFYLISLAISRPLLFTTMRTDFNGSAASLGSYV